MPGTTMRIVNRQDGEEKVMVEVAPQLKKWLKKYNHLMAKWLESGAVLTPEIAREGFAILTRNLVADIPQLALVRDEKIENPKQIVPVRIYHPVPDVALPILIYLHGGGHVAGSVEVYDPICRKIALATRHIVVAVDYRLAPEYRYPAGIEDSVVVLEGCLGLLERIGLCYLPRIALAGDSAGGAMSATLAHTFQGHPDLTISHLMLLYPSLDYTMSLPSVTEFASGYMLEKERICWYFDRYFQGHGRRREVSPLFMKVTDRFPKTLIVTAGFCPLQDEGNQYFSLLKKGGVAAQHLHLDEMIHAFLNMESLVPESCAQVYRAMDDFLQ